jgi:hypothetical protein
MAGVLGELSIHLADHGAVADPLIAQLNSPQGAATIEIDEHLRAGHAEVHEGYEALATRQKTGISAVLRKERQDFLE